MSSSSLKPKRLGFWQVLFWLFLIAVGIIATVYNWWTEPVPESIALRVAGYLERLATSFKALTLQKLGNYALSIVGSAIALMVLAKVLTTLFGTFVSENAIRLIRWEDNLRRIVMAAIISTFGWAAAFIHLYIFDKRFLSLSTLEKIKEKNG